jgi:hypothetical protein
MKDKTKQAANLEKIRTSAQFASYREDARGDLGYALWLALVDKVMYRKVGLSANDLGDYNLWDLYEAGVSPADAAQECLDSDDTYQMFTRDGADL